MATHWRDLLKAPGSLTMDSPNEETSYRLEIVVPAERLSDARRMLIDIGRQLGQRAIYFEVRDGGEIIELE